MSNELKEGMIFRIDVEVDKYTLTRYAERFIFHCNNSDMKMTKANFEKYMRIQLLDSALDKNLDRYGDLTRQAMIFLIKKFKIKMY